MLPRTMKRSFSLLAAVSATFALGGGCTSNTQVCKDGVCKISLNGKGASSTLGGEGSSTIELISASGSQARVKVGGQEGTIVLNEPSQLSDGTLTLTKVEENKIKVTVKTGEAATSDEAAPEDTSAADEAPAS
jgi:hypothetical protein